MVARKAVALIERGRSSTSCDGLLVVLLVVLIVGAPTVFLRSVLFAFAIPQLTMLWVTAMAVFLVGLYRLSGSAARDLGPRLLTSVWIAFASALALTTFFSPQPWVALIGLPGRGAGALTYGFGLVLLHTVYRLGRRRSVEPLLLALVTTHCLVVLYALLQAYGLDPFTWPQTHVGRVASTLGNPNFSAAYVGLTLPLLVWLPFGSARPRTVRIAGGAAVGASSVALCYFISFQGQVTALVAIAVLGLWVGQRVGRERFVAALLAFPTVAAVVVLPLLTKAPSGWFLFGIMVVLGTVSWITCWCEGQWDDPPTEVKETSTRRRWRFRWVFAAATLAGGILGAVLLGQRIAGEISSGLHHRVAYWKTSLSIFRSRPFVGTGLETFGSYLTVHRPRSYAVTWEGISADSPHSVPLGMLGGGGILLAGTYFLLMMVIGYFGYRAVREAVPSMRPVYVSVLAAWVGYHVQSLVSIDVPGLAYTQWVLGGVLLAGGVPTVLREGAPAWGGRRVGSSRRHSTAVSGRQLAAAVVLGAVFLLSLSPLTAPFRGDRAFYRAQEALGAGDLETAGDAMVEAIELQPRNGTFATMMSYIHTVGGRPAPALAELERAARLQPGQPVVAADAANAAIRAGRLDRVEYWFEQTLAREPNGAKVFTESALFFSQIGQPDRARELLESFEELGSGNPEAWRTAEDAYLELGDELRAEQAAICWGKGTMLTLRCTAENRGYAAALAEARAAVRQNRMEEAEHWFEQALEGFSGTDTVLTESALFFSQIGQPDRARELLESFEELGSGEIDAWRTAEHAYLELGDELRAEQAGISGAKLSSS